jgi:hypothetical protein
VRYYSQVAMSLGKPGTGLRRGERRKKGIEKKVETKATGMQ